MIITLDALEGLPVTTDPNSIALYASYLQLEADLGNGPTTAAAQNAKDAISAAKNGVLELIALGNDASLNSNAIAILNQGGMSQKTRPKIKESWKTHIDPHMYALGFSGKAGRYDRRTANVEQIVELQLFKSGGSFVINLKLQPLALVTATGGLDSSMPTPIHARWLYNQTDIWWVSGYDADAMARAANAAAEFLERNVDAAFSELTRLVFSRERVESDAEAAIFSGNLDHVRRLLADRND